MNRIHTITVPYAVMKACPMSWVQRVHIHKGTEHICCHVYIPLLSCCCYFLYMKWIVERVIYEDILGYLESYSKVLTKLYCYLH